MRRPRDLSASVVSMALILAIICIASGLLNRDAPPHWRVTPSSVWGGK